MITCDDTTETQTLFKILVDAYSGHLFVDVLIVYVHLMFSDPFKG